MVVYPERLVKGDTIAFVSPSGALGALCPHRLEQAKAFLEKQGFHVEEYLTTRAKRGFSTGTPQERVADLHAAFKDERVKGIVCTIGGLAANELLPLIDYDLIKANPKIFCGYSDITHLHSAFLRKAGLVTFYGPSAMNQFGEFPEPLSYTWEHFKKATMSVGPVGRVLPSDEWTDEILDWFTKADQARPRKLRKNEGFSWFGSGKAKAPIVGGCLNSLHKLKGTPFAPEYDGRIVFFETSEGEDFRRGVPLGVVDSQLVDLVNAGVFKKVKGVIVGRPFGYGSEEHEQFIDVVKKRLAPLDIPLLMNFNIGHCDPIMSIPLGTVVSMDADNKELLFVEPGVH
ncbi:LD-carboxypeptidase [Candidatus Woesearchaeota archaeon]|nr:LD-carboxypeptidase [Candidatus Woesearchaeota archaeon]